eukprot:COSAG01_NODE_824_length_13299_cov_22.451364_11_plen_98_part_00
MTLLPRSTGFEAKGDNSQGYDYYINFCKCADALRDTFHRYTRQHDVTVVSCRHISSPPASACAQAKGDCAADKYGGCAAFQVLSWPHAVLSGSNKWI